MGKLSRVSQILKAPLESISCILMILILVLIFSEVVSRYIFAQSYGFMEEFSKWGQIWFTCLLMGVVAKARQHITVDILPRKLGERQKTAWLIATDIVTLTFAVVLGWSGVELCHNFWEAGVISLTVIPVPMWIIVLCFPVGAAFLAFFSIEQLGKDIGSLSKPPKGKE
jgi:TRAP-type C4-dicarboxylate transport system permease small subunit